MAASFKVHIRAADRDFYEGECVSLTVPISDGQIGVLAFHAPLAAAVVPGLLTCRLPDGATLTAAAGHGFLRFENNDALLLLDSVEAPQDVDAERSHAAAERAREALKAGGTPQQRLQARYDLERAENRLKAAKRRE